MNKNNISNIDNILSKEISILLFENEIKARIIPLFICQISIKMCFHLKELLENKIYFRNF